MESVYGIYSRLKLSRRFCNSLSASEVGVVTGAAPPPPPAAPPPPTAAA